MYERDGRTDGHHMTAKAALDVSIARQKLLLILTSRHVFKSLDFVKISTMKILESSRENVRSVGLAS